MLPPKESGLNMRTLRRKVDVELKDARLGLRLDRGSTMRALRKKVRQQCVPLSRKSTPASGGGWNGGQ